MAITNSPAPGAAPSDDVHSITTTDVASPALSPTPAPAPAPSGHKHTLSTASTAPPDIESWTVAALESLHLGPDTAPIPVHLGEDDIVCLKLPTSTGFKTSRHTPITRRPPTSKHKLNAEKRERHGKGRLGHRHLRRWENDHLASVPNAQPPSARDWIVQPTYPVLGTVPYALAAAYREREQHHNNKREVVPRDLRLKAKRMPAVRAWVRVLEEPVREFVVSSTAQGPQEEGDEDLVIVDGEGGMTDVVVARTAEEEVVVVQGEGSAFRRWLTHAIADYYGLESRSVCVSGGAKVVCVGARQVGGRVGMVLPRPLWEVC
ncbi:hypothetical protein B0T18DRAFT_155278 [Schizothecium vesticola]|uniref:R3H-associated N-terminal domain-containing protein n=1 Tax=Schizothecium vesticola TaxID=314040 RepID=A0AA40EVZ4_9PEZI|nr:hypothetical protein B0T18DRAFT_155278 [Schizothecium vesticola]